MTIRHMVWRSLRGRPARSALIVFVVMLLAGFLLLSTLVLRGIASSLRTGLGRLGPDLIVVPIGASPEEQEAVFAGSPIAQKRMPTLYVEQIRQKEGVHKASPQLLLGSLSGTPYCVEEMFVAAFEPETDFTVTPWLRQKLSQPLRKGEAISGSALVLSPGADAIELGGYRLALRGSLEPTGIWFDRALFISFETAGELVERSSLQFPVSPATVSSEVSTVSVKVKPGYDIDRAAVKILLLGGGRPVPASTRLTQLLRAQRVSLLRSQLAALAAAWVLMPALAGLLFAFLTGRRRREMGILRALGASRRFVHRLLLVEGAVLSLAGGTAGVLIAVGFALGFGPGLARMLEVPGLLPGLPLFLGLGVGSLVLALGLSLGALLYPVLRDSRRDPAVIMREG